MGTQNELYQRRYAEGITLLQQQMPSKFEMAVSRATDIGERKAFDQLDATEMDEKFGRNTDTPLSDPDHERRWIYTRDFEKAFMFDKEDDLRVFNNPINAYSQAFVAAGNRKKDDLIIEAFDASAITGQNGTGSATFDSSNYEIAAGSANLTPDKVREAREILELADNMEDGDMHRWYLAAAPNQKRSLLGNTEVTSSDFNTVKALVNGEINEWMGFTWIWSTRLPISGNNRSCFAWVKSSMKLGIGANPVTRVGERADKSYGTQVYRSEHCGSTRMDEKGVVRIIADETA